VADDAGALLVRSGLVSSNALDDARARVASIGGTLGEQLVTTGAIGDDDLTDFYRARLLVPQVNPNMLARLTPKVVETIPGDMAIELRAIPVSLDGDNNLTVAMSDPSDRHAVDEIAFFTGAYVVRAVATQMQIAWCLAHYYGHVTTLGQRLLSIADAEAESPIKATSSARLPRTKGLTGKVNATRHRAIAPVTGPVNVARPNSDELDLRPLATPGDPASAAATGEAATAAQAAAQAPGTRPAKAAAAPGPAAAASLAAARAPNATSAPGAPNATSAPGAPRANPASTEAAASVAKPAKPVAPGSSEAHASVAKPAKVAAPGSSEAQASPMAYVPVAAQASSTKPAAAGPESSEPPVHGAAQASSANPPAVESSPSTDPTSSGSAGAARATLPGTLAPFPYGAARPARASAPGHDDDDGPPLVDEPLIPPPVAPGRATADDGVPDKPRARSQSGEIRLSGRRAPSIRPPLPTPEPEEDDEPLIVIEQGGLLDDDTMPPRNLAQRRRIVKSDPPELYARAGEVDLRADADRAIDADEPRIVIDQDALATASRDSSTGPFDRRARSRGAAARGASDVDLEPDAAIHGRESQPILLDRPRGTPEQLFLDPAGPPGDDDGYDDEDDQDTGETNIVVLASRKSRPERQTQVGLAPASGMVRPHRDTETSDERPYPLDGPTALDIHAAPPGDDTGPDLLAAPPAPSSYADTNPYAVAPPPPASRGAAIRPAVIVEDDGADDQPRGPGSFVLSPAELASGMSHRDAASRPGLSGPVSRRHNHDPIDDGWGPPGTTIPPPLLGAIPGSEDDDERNVIPMASVDSSPLVVGPPSLPSPADSGSRAMVRALEDATARAIDLIRVLEHAQSRDQVVNVMVAHLAETHHRAGFFVTRHTAGKASTELELFAMTPKPAVMPYASLRLDQASTLQDIVGTRLPYRGPMHDEASRTFLIAILGACPPEILLVPVAVRERVVGVLFGEHRQRHTFDDQLALAARAAGMALERILKARRG